MSVHMTLTLLVMCTVNLLGGIHPISFFLCCGGSTRMHAISAA